MARAPIAACRVCRRLGCSDPRHKRQRRPQTYGERKLAAEVVRDWVQRYGQVCPGYNVPPHQSNDLTADHLHPLHAGGDPEGTMRVLCRSCNARRGNVTRDATRRRV